MFYNSAIEDDFDFTGMILVVVGIIVAALIFYGVVAAVQNTFKHNPQQPNINENAKRLEEHKRKMQETDSQKERLMDNRKRQLEDYNRRK